MIQTHSLHCNLSSTLFLNEQWNLTFRGPQNWSSLISFGWTRRCTKNIKIKVSYTFFDLLAFKAWMTFGLFPIALYSYSWVPYKIDKAKLQFPRREIAEQIVRTLRINNNPSDFICLIFLLLYRFLSIFLNRNNTFAAWIKKEFLVLKLEANELPLFNLIDSLIKFLRKAHRRD